MMQQPEIELNRKMLLKEAESSRKNKFKDVIRNQYTNRAREAETGLIEGLKDGGLSDEAVVLLGFDFAYSSFRVVLEWGYSTKEMEAAEQLGVQLVDGVYQAGMDLQEEGGSSDNINLLLFRAINATPLATPLYNFSRHRFPESRSKLVDRSVELERRSTCDKDLKHLFWTNAGYCRMRALAEEVWTTDGSEARNRRVVRRAQLLYRDASSIDIHVEGPKMAAEGILDATKELAKSLQPTLLDYSQS